MAFEHVFIGEKQVIDSDTERERVEESNAKKEFGLLRHRLQAHMPSPLRAHLQAVFTEQWLQETVTVETPRGPIAFVMLGKASARRGATLLTKQPATIAWIDGFAPGSVFWDVGANIGVYTLYAALRADGHVVAFEPVAVNYFLLAANCEVNQVDRRVTALPIGVGDRDGIDRIEASQFKAAKSFSFAGKPNEPYPSRQAAIVLSMDRLVGDFGLPCPHYLKIDVPDRTEAILAGGAHVLRRPELREIHLEFDDENEEEARRLTARLVSAGFEPATRHAHRQSVDVTFVRR